MAIEVFGRIGSGIDTMLNWFANLPWWAQLIAFVIMVIGAYWIYNQFKYHT